MTHSALPDNWQELMAGYALGDLSPEEAEELQHLLSTHPDLTTEVNEFQEVLALMPYALPQHEPPPQLRDALLAAVERDPLDTLDLDTLKRSTPTSPATPSLPPHLSDRDSPLRHFSVITAWNDVSVDRHPISQPSQASQASQASQVIEQRRSRLWSLGGLAAAGMIAGLGVGYYNLQQQFQTLQRDFAQLQQESLQDKAFLSLLRQPNAQVYRLNGTGTAAASSGLLVVSPRQQQIAIATQDLPALTQDRIYRLWAMPRNSNTPQYCGQFTVSVQSMAQFDAADVLCSTAIVDQMLVTSERLEDPFEPKGELVLKSTKL